MPGFGWTYRRAVLDVPVETESFLELIVENTKLHAATATDFLEPEYSQRELFYMSRGFRVRRHATRVRPCLVVRLIN